MALARPVDEPPPTHTTTSAPASVAAVPRPLGQLDRHVLHHLVPPRRDAPRRAAPDDVVGDGLGAARRAIRNTRARAEAGHLVADVGRPARPEHHPRRERLVDERLRLTPPACRARKRAPARPPSAAPCARRASATRRSQPVAAGPRSTVTPGCSSVSTSSHVAGSGRRMPRSVITTVGPPPRSPSCSRVPGPSPKPDRRPEVAPLHERRGRSGGRSRSPRRADAAISGAPPAPGRRTSGCVVGADHCRVDVAEAVDLGGARGTRRRCARPAASRRRSRARTRRRRPSRPARRRRSTAAGGSASAPMQPDS